MRTCHLALVVEYDGTGFSGWQVQPGQRTVQGVLEEAFSDLTGARVRVTGAGRTDAGVHALAQVATATIDSKLTPEAVAAAVNARLGDDVRIHRATPVSAGFHPRHDAVARSYTYLIGLTESPLWKARRWFVRGEIDVDAMRGALPPLQGDRDFRSFELAGSDPGHEHRCHVTAVRLEWIDQHGGMIRFDIESNRFLRGMVRSIVGTLVEVGRRKYTADDIEQIVAARDRSRAGPTAPPWGLYLTGVRYNREVRI